MFKRHRPSHPDFSTRLRSEIRLWNVAPQTTRIEIVADISTICVDVPAQLFAVGTSRGEIRVYNEQFKEAILIVPKGFAVKLLQFVRPRDLFKLLCIDSKYVLHVWNLDVHGNPILQASQPLNGPVYRISTSLSHSHALLASQSGDVVTYDLATLSMSPYKIPTALDGQQSSRPCISPATDVALLPQRLNHILIGYSGGIVLYDLLSREVIRSYGEASVLGANNSSPSLMTLSLHPAGQHYAAGYEDGTISIWNLESSKKVWFGTTTRKFSSSDPSDDELEPIFKLEWMLAEAQDGSSTSWLVVLGGQPRSCENTGGVSALSFDLHRTTAESSNFPYVSYLYPSPKPVQDFAVLPVNPMLANPYGRLFLTSGYGDPDVCVEAFKFPPLLDPSKANPQLHEDKAVQLEFSAELEDSEERSRNLAVMLEDLKSELLDEKSSLVDYSPPIRISLPLPLCAGITAVLAAEMVSLNKAEYLRLVRRLDEEDTLGNKNTQYRILITRHADASVRFHDVSALAGINLSLHPLPLDHLTIRVLEIPEFALRPDICNLRIANIVIARESLECAVHMSTGEVVVLGLNVQPRTQDVLDKEIVDLSDVQDHGDVFVPRFILQAQKDNTVVVCLSDIGFLAVAFQHGLLMVVDLRGPRVILRDTQDATSKHGEVNVVVSLCWTVSGVGDDTSPAPRLLALRHDGTLTVYTLTRIKGAWAIDGSRISRHIHHSLNAPILSVVLDAQTGLDCRATPSGLVDAMELTMEATRGTSSHCFWVAANRREIRTCLNITGDKVSKIAFSTQDTLDHVNLVNAYDSSVLVAFTHGRVVIYSLPILEAIHTFQLPGASEPRDSILCTPAGDILETCRSQRASMILMFTPLLAHSRSSASGSVNFRHHKYMRSAPTEARSDVQSDTTQTWGSNITSWIKGFAEGTPVTGDDIDRIFAGSEVAAEAAGVPKEPMPAALSRSGTKRKSESSSATLGSWGQDMYQQLTSAATERGERLGELQEQFQQLEAGSKDLVTQAKKLAEKQAVKRWFL